PVCLSASHIAFGSIRMEAVFMVMAQSAATAAVMAIDAGVDVQNINVTELQNRLASNPLLNNTTIEIIVDNDDKDQVVINGNCDIVTGGYGKNLFVSENSDQKKPVKYTPEIQKKRKYAIYAYRSEEVNKSTSTYAYK